MNTTLNQIREFSPCASGWKKLLAHLEKTTADDEPLSILTVLDSNGLDDALWCLRAVKGHDREIRLFGIWCARRVQHLMTDPRSIAALDVAEQFANGQATKQQLAAARDAARDTAWDVERDAAWFAARVAAGAAAAWDAARAAAWAAARDVAWDAAWDVAWDAAWDVARDVAWDAARDAAWFAAWSAAWDAARDAQTSRLREICAECEVTTKAIAQLVQPKEPK